MSRRKLKARNRITQKMSKDGLVERNETTGANTNISQRAADVDLRNNSSDDDVQDVGPEAARSVRLPYSRFGNKQDEKPSESTRKRNKTVYRQHNQSYQERETATPQAETPQHGQPVQPEQAQNQQPTQGQDTAAASQQEPPPSAPPEPSNQYNPQGQKPDSGKFKTRRGTSYRHDKPPVLQTVTQTALQNKVTSEPILKHQEDEPIIEGRDSTQPKAKRRRLQIPDGQDAGGNNTPSEGQTNSQVENKQNNPTPSQQEQSNTDSRPEHSEDRTVKPPARKRPAPKADSDNNADNPQSSGNEEPKNPNRLRDTPETALKPEKDSRLQADKDSRLQFTEGETTPKPPPKSRALVKAEKGVERANNKLVQAKANLPTKRKLRTRLVFDEEKGKQKREFFIEKQAKTQAEHLKGPLPFRPVKSGVNSALNFTHGKIFQIEHENVEIKAAHRGEMAAEGGVRGTLRHRRARKYRKVAKLEHKVMKKNMKLTYRQALEKNPKLKSNLLSRMWQKRKIKKQYAKAAREAKRTAGGVKKGGSFIVRTAGTAVRIILKSPKAIILLLIVGLVLALVMAIISLGMALGGGGMGAVVASTYLAEDEDITSASVLYTALELDLIEAIENIPTSHPGFDEYRIEIDIGLIRHNPFELMAYLTAVHLDFSEADIAAHLQSLFASRHQLVFTPTIEIRFTEDEDGNPVPYDWHVLTVTMNSRPFSELLQERMTGEQQLHFTVLMETLGNRQRVASPFDFNWIPFISSHFGYRINPISGGRQFHAGIDIALPTGTPIRAGHDGIVTFAGYSGGFGYLVIIDSGDGLVTKYAHSDTLLVTTGQSVSVGDIIATVGSTGDSTGAHLHMEVLIDGRHLNPAFLVAPQ